MKQDKSSHRYNDIKVRKCSNDLQSKMRELQKAIDELLEIGHSPWIEYKDIMVTFGLLNWTISTIKQGTSQLEGKIEMSEFRSSGMLS
jgi:hypothetical protein